MKDLIINNEININNLKERFINYIDVSENTMRTYSTALDQFIKWLSKNNIKQPKREDIIQYKKELIESCKTTSINSYLTAIKQFFSWLCYERIYPNIAENVKSVKVGEISKNYLTLDQIKEIMSKIIDKRERAIFTLLVTTGLRLIELQRMDIEDISVLYQERVIYVQGKGRLDKNEYVKISDEVYKYLMEYIGDRTTGPVFISTSNNNHNKRVTTKTLRLIVKNMFKNYLDSNEVYTCHGLRGSFSSIAMENGASIYEISKVLRHANIQTTMHYLRAVDRQKNKTEINVSNLIFNN